MVELGLWEALRARCSIEGGRVQSHSQSKAAQKLKRNSRSHAVSKAHRDVKVLLVASSGEGKSKMIPFAYVFILYPLALFIHGPALEFTNTSVIFG